MPQLKIQISWYVCSMFFLFVNSVAFGCFGKMAHSSGGKTLFETETKVGPKKTTDIYLLSELRL